MKTFKTLMAVFALAFAFASCSKEDDPQPLFHSPASFYMPADSATDSTSVMRREFYSSYGSYLLFNDTIQKNYMGTDINGDDVYSTETIDLGYYIGFSYSSTDTYTYTYITDYETQKKMRDFLEEYILYHFQGKIKPFLYFLCKTIAVKYRAGNTSYPYSASGQRGVAIAGNYLLVKNRSEAQKKKYSMTVIVNMIGQLATNYSDYFEDFYEYSNAYYGVYWTQYGEEKTSALAKLGFIGGGNFSISAPDRDTDLSQFAEATLQYSQEDFAKKYADYPVIVEKYNYVRKVLTELGFVYDN